MNFLLLIISLPTDNTAGRMRSWRAIKASGAAVLRDGVYLLPERASCLADFQAVFVDVQAGGGAAYLLKVSVLETTVDLAGLFQRDADYAVLLQEIERVVKELASSGQLSGIFKKITKLRKTLMQLTAIDFFPNASQQQVSMALEDLEQAARRLMSPDEPRQIAGVLAPLAISDYQNKLWATRRRPWVDRLACAWLIRRFIDQYARFLWLESPSACPPDALGFDFDGAAFSHVGHYVTFEVLLKRFQLEQAGLKRVAALVHYLDVGGVQAAEACGVESVLKGLRETLTDDDQLLAAASGVFDGLLAAFAMATGRQ
ncbi:MAG: chromate resistance protein [Methylovulum sp.]|uniref:chromate resistance protein ChrB domain-containing protein n=1 Tax=Methylovulum sp. TaxID=1916980 RepID=UPI0026235D9D|nr:chromate resistance protein ChrB domain-containing protein [Methylovulum sp.]MDD2725275.1 chromate resistance protein [Methylovulum sp.]MDD5125464.1 chromate resistance protein [Methylovulum sp.]